MQIRRAVVLGSDPAGVSFAAAVARAGARVCIVEADPNDAERVTHFLRGPIDKRITIVASDDPISTCDLVYTDLIESLDRNSPKSRSLAQNLPADALLVTSAIENVDRAVLPTHLRDRLVGFYISEPSHLRKLVEISADFNVRPDVVTAAFELARAMGKTPVHGSGDRLPMALRLQRRYFEAADTALMDGAIPHEVDEAMVAFGFDLGPYELQDLIGLDVLYQDRMLQSATRDPNRRYIPIADRMVQEGRLGKKVGVGWYRYPGGGGAVIDPLVEDLIREEARFDQVVQREFCAEELQHRLILSLIHESAAMLADGATDNTEVINQVSVAGLGFPAALGGVIDCFDAWGAEWVNDALTNLAKEDSIVWYENPALQECAATGKPLSDWRAAPDT